MSGVDSFRAALARLHEQCPEILGSVLATSEGLILAASGELASDAAAATAVHLAEEADRCLKLISGDGCEVMLVWGDSEVWCLSQLSAHTALMARANAECRAGALRLAVKRLGRELAPELGRLGAAADAAADGNTFGTGDDAGTAYYEPA